MQLKEIFESVQGEGFWTGRAAVFVRFSGCKLWDGQEDHRIGSICQFCDTDFLDGLEMGEEEVIFRMSELRPRFVVFTGGEPALQVTSGFIQKVKSAGFYTAIETNGTIPLPTGIDWVCVSPKTLKVNQPVANECKVVWPQKIFKSPETWINSIKADHYWLSPMFGQDGSEATCFQYVLDHPQWRISTQMHKAIGVR